MKTKMVLCALALVIISGCETTKMSMELTGATVGAAVGGFGGAQLGSGLGMWAYSAGGVIVGGLVGCCNLLPQIRNYAPTCGKSSLECLCRV